MNTNLYVPQFLDRFFVREVATPFVMNDALVQEIRKVAANMTTSCSSQSIASLNGRLERGLELALIGSVKSTPLPNKPHLYRVLASDKTHSYQVDLDSKTCDCQDSQKGYHCKHRVSAYLYQQATDNLCKVDLVPAPVVQTAAAVPNRTEQILKELGYEAPKKVAEVVETEAGPRLGFLYRKYLHGDELGHKPFRVTIVNVTKEIVISEITKEPHDKWCLWVDGLPRFVPTGILFGPTGEKELLEIFGRIEIQNLKGKVMEIYPKSLMFATGPRMTVHFRKFS